ncbi:MAG: N-acetylmuramoyl-L-alanine amidase, partial [Chloroflexota bacterium]|nr:N-acetylmuramoyl-L-alanine amidase [Chloroflexota bacterium]
MRTAPERKSRDRALGAWILLGAVLFAVLTVGLRAGPLAEPVPAPTPLPTASPPSLTPEPIETAVLAPSPASGAAGRTVCIDPGHGGADRGNVRLDEDGQILLQEKDFTLPHSLMLADRLRAAGIDVV